MFSRLKKCFSVSPRLHMLALRLHIFLAALFSLPLLIVIITGAALATVPLFRDYPGPPPIEQLEQTLTRFNDDHSYQFLMLRNDIGEARIVTISAQGMAMKHADLFSGEVIEPSPMEAAYLLLREIHVHLNMDMRWVVEVSTWVLMLIMLSGLIMLTRYRLRRTLIGWHYGVAMLVSVPVFIMSVSGIVILEKHKAMENNPPPIITETRSKTSTESQPLDITEIFRVLRQHKVATVTSIQNLPNRYSVSFTNQVGENLKYDGQQVKPAVQSKELPWGDIHLGRWLGLPMIAFYAASLYALIASMGFALYVHLKKRFKRRKAKRLRAQPQKQSSQSNI